jgi:small ligand-binding sensory domain FIST
MARFGDGLAAGSDLVVAAESAARAALEPLRGRLPDLACVFVSGGSPDETGDAFRRAAQVTAAGATIGCNAAGVIGGGQAVEGERAVSVFAAVLPDVRVRSFHLEVMRAEAGAAVVGLPELGSDEVAVLLADPHSFPADGFLAQANAALPGLIVIGGLASGVGAAGATRLLIDGRLVDRGAVGVLLQGAGVRTIVSQGCRGIGPAMTVTAATENVVRELAGVPALQRVEQVLAELPPGDQALASGGLQLGIAMDEYTDEHDFLVRAILGAEQESGGIVVGDVVEVGRTVRLQVRDADAADADLRALLAAYRRDTRDAPAGGALLFSCNGRGRNLFGASHGGAGHDASLVRDELAVLGLAGFFAAGELGPVGGRNHLHGFTASVLAFPS